MRIRSAYYYLVCLVTLVMVLFGAVEAVQSGLDLVLPPAHYAPSPVEIEMRYRHGEEASSAYTREELEAMAEEEAERMAHDQRRGTIRSLLGSLALIAFAAPVYLYHWRTVRREDALRGENPSAGPPTPPGR